MRKRIANQDQWNKVISELENEHDKLQTYDYTILQQLGDVTNLKILDYGSGPGILAEVLIKLKAKVKVYDISAEIRAIAADKLGKDAVFDTIESIPDSNFDVVLCSLVLCIITEEMAKHVLTILAKKVSNTGRVYIGFCNPGIFRVKESRLDFRFPVGKDYNCVHDYRKIKKEGNYEIIEKHRPITWYKTQIKSANLKVVKTLFTPEYEMNGNKIEDFIIFELKRDVKQDKKLL